VTVRARIEGARCDCEYPCSCLRYEGVEYGGYEEVIYMLEQRIEKLTRAAYRERDTAIDQRKWN
jgi:hypothetical protein